ncbi:polycomb group RING finger protein 3 [Camelus ferus]|nr:polycomb group RING finger protein 3 [Camelus ferus]
MPRSLGRPRGGLTGLTGPLTPFAQCPPTPCQIPLVLVKSGPFTALGFTAWILFFKVLLAADKVLANPCVCLSADPVTPSGCESRRMLGAAPLQDGARMGAVVLSRNWPWAQMSDRGCGVGEDGAGEGTPQAHTTSPVGVCPKRLSRDVTMTVRSRLMPNADAHLLKPKMLTRKIKLWDINAHITCRLCSGYLIDATTVTECLHTFCRSCLVKYLEENNTCPTCRIVIHQSHPLQYIGGSGPGPRLSTKDLGPCATPGVLGAVLCPLVSICLECNSSKLRGLKRKWIRCSAQATVLHLKKFIAKKLNLSSFNELDILCNEEILGKDHTLKFVVVTRWRFKKAPLLLHYRPKMDLL